MYGQQTSTSQRPKRPNPPPPQETRKTTDDLIAVLNEKEIQCAVMETQIGITRRRLERLGDAESDLGLMNALYEKGSEDGIKLN